jgi:hypothetical protein
MATVNDEYRQSKDIEDGQSEKPRVSDVKDGQEEEPWYKTRSKASSREDPFGDEENSEVRYKTMRW